jgi:hypothetical protein
VAGVVLLIAIVACGPASATERSSASLSQAVSETSLQPSGDVVWARVPYCNCLATSATANVSSALKDANLTVSLKEQSPHDGWLYFVVTFDSDSATRDQVGEAIAAGGGQMVEGPP